MYRAEPLSKVLKMAAYVYLLYKGAHKARSLGPQIAASGGLT